MAEETIVTDDSEDVVDVVEELSMRDKLVSSIVEERIETREKPEELLEGELKEEEPIGVIEDDDTVTLQVNGQEQTVPRSEVLDAGVRTLQKETAADEKLREAALKETALEERAQELARMEEELLEKQNQQKVEADNAGKEFADAITEFDEDKIAEGYTAITARLNAIATAQEKVVAEREFEKQSENEKVIHYYHEQYEDISQDPDMHSSLNRRLAEVSTAHPAFTPQQVIDEAAGQVYKKFGISTGKETPKDVKDKMPRQPRKAAGRKPREPEVKPRQRSDVIASMRGKRGVQAY